jgi:hypothetical protein
MCIGDCGKMNQVRKSSVHMQQDESPVRSWWRRRVEVREGGVRGERVTESQKNDMFPDRIRLGNGQT